MPSPLPPQHRLTPTLPGFHSVALQLVEDATLEVVLARTNPLTSYQHPKYDGILHEYSR